MIDYKENLVSIIIPVHNSQKFLEECIESALSQTYPNIEIIAIDDGSTDNSLKILKKYSNKIKLIETKNSRIATAVNQGLKIAKGEWMKRLDSDDVLYPNAIENLVSVGKNIEDKRKTMLYGHYDLIDSTSKVTGKKIQPNYNNLEIFDFNVILLHHFIGLPSSSLIHRSTIEEYGLLNESFERGEDYEFWLRNCLLHNCRLRLVPKTIVKYRIHSNQIMVRTVTGHKNTGKQIRESILEKLNSNDRLLYEKSYLKYRKSKPLSLKIWYFILNIILKLPPSISGRIMIFVRRKDITGKFFIV